jgi:hypothetical protein
MIRRILSVHTDNVNADDGDRHLSDPVLAIEAIEAAVYGDDGNPILKGFLDA